LSKLIEKYLNELLHKISHIKSLVKTSIVNSHHWCKDNRLYARVAYEFGTIVLNGFFIWVMLFPFLEKNPLWFIPSYGIVPWFLINLKQEMFK